MVKPKKIGKSRKRCRTALEIEEEQSRTLYIRLPKTIKNVDEINELFFGDFKVKLPRQSGRHCHVIFSDIKAKIRNLKSIKNKVINGKPIFAAPPKPMNLEKKKSQHKKFVMSEPKEEPSIGKYLFISNIAPGVKASELKDAFSGSVTVGLLKGLRNGTRSARLKMSSSQICSHYIQNESNWPTFNGKKVKVTLSKKTINYNKLQNVQGKKEPLKLNNSESACTNSSKSTKESETKEKLKNISNKVEINNESNDEDTTENEEDTTENDVVSDEEYEEEGKEGDSD